MRPTRSLASVDAVLSTRPTDRVATTSEPGAGDADLDAASTGGLSRTMHRLAGRVRIGVVVVLALDALLALHAGWTGAPLPLWVAATAAPATVLVAGGASRAAARVLDRSEARHWADTTIDIVTVVAITTVFAPLIPPSQIGTVLVVVPVTAALRLPGRDAAALTLLQFALVALVRVQDPLPWSLVPVRSSLDDLVVQLVTALLSVWLVSWALAQLDRRAATAAAVAREREQVVESTVAAYDRLHARHQQLQTHARGLERAASEAAAAAEALQRRSDDHERFAAVVAHDLASPLATLRGIATTLQRTDFDRETRARLLASALNTATRASALVDRLHEHARAGAAVLAVEDVDLGDVAREVADDQSAATVATDSVIEVAPELPRIRCDRVLVRQLLANLVGNALRHGAGPDGRAHVLIDAATVDGSVRLTVRDRGAGIDPAIADGLFTVGVRGGHSRGLGLGLGTCRTIVERHGGTIDVSSPASGGTTILVTLPTAGRRTVLLVESDDTFRRRCRGRIEAVDGRVVVVEASSLAEARRLLRAGAVDAAVVGLDLTDGSGLDLLVDLSGLLVPVRVVARDGHGHGHIGQGSLDARPASTPRVRDRSAFVEEVDRARLFHPSLVPA